MNMCDDHQRYMYDLWYIYLKEIQQLSAYVMRSYLPGERLLVDYLNTDLRGEIRSVTDLLDPLKPVAIEGKHSANVTFPACMSANLGSATEVSHSLSLSLCGCGCDCFSYPHSLLRCLSTGVFDNGI